MVWRLPELYPSPRQLSTFPNTYGLNMYSSDPKEIAKAIAMVGSIVNSAMQHSSYLFNRMSLILGDHRMGSEMQSVIEPRTLASNQTELSLLSEVLDLMSDATKELAWLMKRIRIEPGGSIAWK